jgi:hypothetical protein
MTLDRCIACLAFEVESGEASYLQDRVDGLIMSYIRGGDFNEAHRRRRVLADAFKIAVPPTPLSARILDRILGVSETAGGEIAFQRESDGELTGRS